MSSIIKVNTITTESGSTLTVGESGKTVALASGASQTGFGRSGAVNWQSSIKTANFAAVSGEGYFCDTSSGSFTVTLPSSPSAGDIVAVKDYAETFNTNSLIIGRNSSNIGGLASNASIETAGIAVTLVYADSTKGWLVTEDGVQSSAASLPYTADFLVIAGGGSGGIGPGGNPGGGGAGAGGYRASFNSEASGGGGSSESSLTFRTGIVYTITVGAGASARPLDSTNAVEGTDGTNSSISGSNITTITSTGGGGGSGGTAVGRDGGSGGGNCENPGSAAGQGTANQGFNGGQTPTDTSDARNAGAGGGGAGAVGVNISGGGASANGGNGGAGVASTITGSSVTRAGGGGGGSYGGNGGTGGTGGGGDGADNSGVATAGTTNTGSGGGGGRAGGTGGSHSASGAGGSGVVIISIPDANYSGTTTGSPTVATGVSGKTVLTFTGDGSYTA
jgi:hypothetical protein|tara:strand:- start:486 stop:1832 length:1347 start_codon:yes stop_codon:yes gene_type:complete